MRPSSSTHLDFSSGLLGNTTKYSIVRSSLFSKIFTARITLGIGGRDTYFELRSVFHYISLLGYG